MKSLAIRMIEFYQRFLSPYKGYRCAHAAFYGSLSCSEAVKQIVQREGLWGGRRQIRDRFRACGVAARQLRSQRKTRLVDNEGAPTTPLALFPFSLSSTTSYPVYWSLSPEKPPFREHPANNEKQDNRPSSRDSFNKRDCCGTGDLCIVIPCDFIPFDGCLLDLFCVGCDGC
ncbi:MAG: membrane protein insertion efficiency factor YidD [Planctomycetales bacterium]|nr:membrane protein insertion efficiency factor YidD [Planctomycetales bacterium]